jgi:crotonobetainyl-CoA:carnitine CoA-transferase CaiB-like acyl-CoA transferase
MATAQELAAALKSSGAEHTAAVYAASLLADVGNAGARAPQPPERHPAEAWAHSGLMALTGLPDGAPLMCPAPLAACADGALAALASLAPQGALAGLCGAQLLAERAAIRGLRRSGAAAPNGGCRLLPTRDGALAASLVREEDWALVPAWLETQAHDWEAVRAAVARGSLHDLVERGRELGLAVAPDVPVPSRPVPWLSVQPAQSGSGLAPRAALSPAPLVVDLSALWAGPLCTHLLQRCGARVIKVESRQRPDGARHGPAAFFALLNAGKESLALDFSDPADVARLRALLVRADVVIEASRPRALRQLGIRAQALLEDNPRLSWLTITGYGLGEPHEHWIAYGDDAAVNAGLSYSMRQATGLRLIVGDAVADPLTGLHAAFAAWASWRAGGGRRISIALCDVVRHVLQFDWPSTVEALRARQREWSTRIAPQAVRAPQARMPTGPAPALGADTAALLTEFGLG